MACVFFLFVSRFCKIEIENVAVFPVPDCALDGTSDDVSDCSVNL